MSTDVSNSNCYLGLYSGNTDSDFGLQNTYLGYYSGTNVINTTNSTFIGAATSQTAGQLYTMSTAVGYGANISASNQIVLGTSSETVLVPGTAAATSVSTGALQLAGGLGVSGDIYCRNISANINNVNLTSVNANAPHNIVLTNGTTGGSQLSTDYNTDFTYNPATSVFKFANTTLDGSNNTCTVSATQVQITSDNTNTTCYIPFTKATAGPNQSLYVDDTTGPLTYNPSTSTISFNTASLNYIPMSGTDPGINFVGGANKTALGYASSNGSYSTSAVVGDTVLRSDTNQKLILQSGSGAGPIIIDGSNSILIQPGYTTPPTLTSSQIGYFSIVSISANITISGLAAVTSITIPSAGYYFISYNLSMQFPITTTFGYVGCFFGTSSGQYTNIDGTSRLVYIPISTTNTFGNGSASTPYLCTAANTILYLNATCIGTTTNYPITNSNSYMSFMRIM